MHPNQQLLSLMNYSNYRLMRAEKPLVTQKNKRVIRYSTGTLQRLCKSTTTFESGFAILYLLRWLEDIDRV